MQPVNYTISYYQGDDFSLIIYPKNADGNPIDLTGATASFKIANVRGPSSTDRIVGGAVIEPVNGGTPAIVASLSSADGVNVGNGFVYDISYVKDGKTITVLTGTFSVILEVVV